MTAGLTGAPEMLDRTRLWLATFLVWAAARIGPKSMRNVFGMYSEMLADFSAQVAMSRTYGVMMAAWGYDDAIELGKKLQSAAISAVAEARRAMESTNP